MLQLRATLVAGFDDCHEGFFMSIRAVLIGLVSALCIAGFGYINNQIIRLEPLESGHLIPVAVIGLLLMLVGLNALLFHVAPRHCFRPAELAVVGLMAMIACSVPGRGLMEQFTTSLVMPIHLNRLNPGWQENKLLDYMPSDLMADGRTKSTDDGESRFASEGKYARVVQPFVSGSETPDEYISLSDVPWSAWRKPLMNWLPLLLCTTLAVICLALIVDHQWREREHLPYPIAEFTASLLQREPHQAASSIFYSRLFWLGLASVATLRVWNGLAVWYPDVLVPVELRFNLWPLEALWPPIRQGRWASHLMVPTIYPIAIGFSYFLSTEVSFSVGISHYIFVPLSAVLISYGVDMNTSYLAGGSMGWHRAAAYVAFGIIIFYTGRQYYGQVLRCALTGRVSEGSEEDVSSTAVNACRILLLALVGMTLILIHFGVDWTLALLTVALVMLIFLGVSRISVETGLFLIHPRWQPVGVFIGMLGAYALGPQALILVGFVCIVLCLDPSQSVMPYFVNALGVCNRFEAKPGRVAWAGFSTYAVSLGLAVVVVLWAQYNFGAPMTYNWATSRVPSMSLRPADTAVYKLKAQGLLEESEGLSAIERITSMRPDPTFFWWAGSGFVLVLVVSALRLRVKHWPLHPVIFLLWSTYAVATLHHSFLIGWLIKRSIMKYGGMGMYQKVKPLMIGIIAGDLIGVLIFMVAGAVHYVVLDELPPAYRVFPR